MKATTTLLVFALFLASALSQVTYEVVGTDFKFEPANLNISKGDTVHWKWTGFHDVSEVDAANATTPSGGFLSGDAVANGEFTFTFNSTGTFYYVCTVHVDDHNMRGQVNVFNGVEFANGTFSPSEIQVNVGETIRFHWADLNNLIQVENASSVTPVADGMTSGDPIENGEWIVTFEEQGIFYFASESAGENATVIKVTVGTPVTASAPGTSAPVTSAPATSAPSSAPQTSAPVASSNLPTDRERDSSAQLLSSLCLVLVALLVTTQF
jgi:plastocyanin